MTTLSTAAYRVRTTAGSQIVLIEELPGAPRKQFAPLTVAEARALAQRLTALADQHDIECTGGVPPTEGG